MKTFHINSSQNIKEIVSFTILILAVTLTSQISKAAEEVITPQTLQTISLAKKISGLAGALDGCGRKDDAKTVMNIHFELLLKAEKSGFIPTNLITLLELGFKSYDESKEIFSSNPPFPCSQINTYIAEWKEEYKSFEKTLNAKAYVNNTAPQISNSEALKILDAVNKFGSSISCASRPAEKDRIAILDHGNEVNSDYHRYPLYAVIWDGDIGCDFNGRLGPHIAIVTKGPGNSYFVVPAESAPAISVEPFGLVEKIIASTEQTITLDSVTLGPEDPRCCPTNRRRVTLTVDRARNWSVSNITPLLKK